MATPGRLGTSGRAPWTPQTLGGRRFASRRSGVRFPVSPPRPEALSVHREGPLSCPSSSKVRQRVSQDPLSELVAEALERLNQTPNDLGAALASQSESIPDGELSQSR